jgi:hypothetical protein
MIAAERSEMAIPRWSLENLFYLVLFTILVLASIVAVLNLVFRWDEVGMIASCLWLAILGFGIWLRCKQQGGLREVLLDCLDLFARRQFVESVPRGDGSVEIRFGFQLFGFRTLRFNVPLDKIETVEWSPGQAPKYWCVFIWFDHDIPELSQKRRQQKWVHKPDQDVYSVGPSRRKKTTAAFGLAFVEFLCRAGATLVRRDGDCTFVRAAGGTGEQEEPLANAVPPLRG